MTYGDGSKIIRIVHPICCGRDVHKKGISAYNHFGLGGQIQTPLALV